MPNESKFCFTGISAEGGGRGEHHKAFENFTFLAILSIPASQVVKSRCAKYLGELRHTSCQCPPPHGAELLGAARHCQSQNWSLDCSYCKLNTRACPALEGKKPAGQDTAFILCVTPPVTHRDLLPWKLSELLALL